MLKILSLGIAVLIYLVPLYLAQPNNLYREKFGFQIMATSLLNMTLHLCKDAMLKLRMAARIQEDYKNSFSYELGLLAAGIMDKFKHMLRIYRFYSNHGDFKAHKHEINNIMSAYGVMQSDYNEIRAEKDLYFEVLDQHKRRREEEDRQLAIYVKRNPGMSLQALKDSRDKGLKPPGMYRRAINYNNMTVKFTNSTRRNEIQKPDKKLGKVEWTKNSNPEEAEYKKKLRYIMWAERWQGFNPETEGVDIPMEIANVGLANASNFLVKELKGDF